MSGPEIGGLASSFQNYTSNFFFSKTMVPCRIKAHDPYLRVYGDRLRGTDMKKTEKNLTKEVRP